MNESQKKAMEIVDNIRKTLDNGNTKHLEGCPSGQRLNVLQATMLCILLVLFVAAVVYISLQRVLTS